MCGRYQIAMEDDIIAMREILDEINERYKDVPEPVAAKAGEIFPTDTAPVLIPGSGKPQATLMKWGFPKPSQQCGVIINARAETAPDRPMFRSSLVSRRCIVPTTGFFEWHQESGGKKAKYLFRLPETEMLYLAGLYGAFTDGSRPYNAYVILTTSANSSVAPYHDRMPLVLMLGDTERWLSDTAFAHEYARRFCPAMLHATAI